MVVGIRWIIARKFFFGGCFGIMILFPDYCMFKIFLAEFSDDLDFGGHCDVDARIQKWKGDLDWFGMT